MNTYLKNNEIKDVMLDSLQDKLKEYEGLNSYACDLAYTLYESENMDGCIFSYYTKDNDNFIKEHWDDLPEILDELKFNFGSDYFSKILLDMFDNSCRFVVVICLEVANYLLGQCDYINEHWNEEITLNNETIDLISKQLEELRD